jgi:hypothetical protein
LPISINQINIYFILDNWTIEFETIPIREFLEKYKKVSFEKVYKHYVQMSIFKITIIPVGIPIQIYFIFIRNSQRIYFYIFEK